MSLVRLLARREVPLPRRVPRRVRLDLAELVLAARLAGDVPLPFTLPSTLPEDDADLDGDRPAERVTERMAERMAERLAGRPDAEVGAEHVRRLHAELERVDDDGDRGAAAGLAERGLVIDGVLEPGLAGALQVLAGGPLSLRLDVSVRRRAGDSRVRSWFGVAPGLVAQLSTGTGLDLEVAWFDPQLWVSQLERAARVQPWVPQAAAMEVPAYADLPSELLVGAQKACREQRTDLLAGLARSHRGRVRLGRPGEVAEADDDQATALLHTLGQECRGRLRLQALRRDRLPEARPAVLSWLLLDDGWHELRPGRHATTVLRRREPRDLGVLTAPLVQPFVTEPEGDGS